MADFEIQGAVNMATANPLSTGHFKIAIIGDPGEGKSWLGASAASEEERMFQFDFDGRMQSLARHKNKGAITSKTYQDVDYPNKYPTAWSDFLSDINAMELAYEQKKLPFKWFLYDSATYGSVACINWLMYSNPSMRRELVVAGHKTYIPKSFDTYKAELAEITGAWSRLLVMGNLIVTFHLAEERDVVNSTKEEAKYTGRKTVAPPRYVDLLSLFNDQWRIKATGGNCYEVQTASSWDFIAKSTMILDETERTADIRAMMQKHMSKAGA